MKNVLVVFGTRPEAIKLAPVVRQLQRLPSLGCRVCVTAQHRELLDQVLRVFELEVHHDLDLMQAGQTLAGLTARILTALDPVLAAEQPHLLVVQGDTTTAFAAALAAFYRRIPVAHVEAGLRTGDPAAPFPEEVNRVLAGRLASLHFPPTEMAAANLAREGVDARRIVITGNTAVDAVLEVQGRLERGELAGGFFPFLDPLRKLIVVTAHRRESFGEGFRSICSALRRLALRRDVQIVFPVHPNPEVRAVVERELRGAGGAVLLEPLEYLPFVDLMRRAHFLLTDSGGIQEEAPSLGKPVLVMRDRTERPEAVVAGTARLVGTAEAAIVRESVLLLEDTAEYARRSQVSNPYGDGHAGERIAQSIQAFLGK